MRHFSLFDDMGDGFEKKAADDNYFTIDLGSESALLGLMDVLTWTRDNGKDDVEELSNYLNDLYSASDYTLRLNAAQFAQIRNAFYNFMNDIQQFESRGEFEEAYPDFEIEDIWEAEDRLIEAEMEPSSGKGLEDIPTMEKNPEDLAEGEVPAIALEPQPQAQPENASFESCPMCGEKAIDPMYGECENCGWNRDNACPECRDDRSITVDEFGSARCNNCGWGEEDEHPVPGMNQSIPGALPPLTDAGKKIKSLEDAFAAPPVEHPLGPHTGGQPEEEKIDLYGTGNCESCGAALGKDGECFNWMKHQPEKHPCPQCGTPFDTFYCPNCQHFRASWPGKKDDSAAKLEEAFNAPDAEHPLGPHTGAEEESGVETYGPECVEFYNNQHGWSAPAIWSIRITPAEGQRDPQPGDIAQSKKYGQIRNMILTNQLENGSWEFKNDYSGRFASEESPEESKQELYTSGRYVKCEAAKSGWVVDIFPAGGQRPPKVGDLATIQQKTKRGFNRPVPLTLTADLGVGWEFINGHHPA